MSNNQNLCSLANVATTYANPQRFGDGKMRQLFPAVQQNSRLSQLATAIQYFKAANSQENGYFNIMNRLRGCSPQGGDSGTICSGDYTVWTEPQKSIDKVEIEKFKPWTSNVLKFNYRGTMQDYCISDGKDNQYYTLAGWYEESVQKFNIDMEKLIADALKNSISPFYPDGSSTATLKTLPLYTIDTVTGLYHFNPAALVKVSSELEILGLNLDSTYVAGSKELLTVKNALAGMPMYAGSTVAQIMNRALISVELPTDPILNRQLLYFFDPNAFNILTYSEFFHNSTIMPIDEAKLKEIQMYALESDAQKGQRTFAININGNTFDMLVTWEKCGFSDLEIKMQLSTRYYLHQPINTECYDFRVLPFDVCPMPEPKACAPSTPIISKALCLDVTPLTNCADAISGAYVLTYGANTVSGNLSFPIDLQTQQGVNFLFKYLLSQNGIANITQNNGKCGGLIITGKGDYTPTLGDAFTVEFPCATITATVVDCECGDCVPSSARVVSFTKVLDTNTNILTVTPEFEFVNDSATAYAWSLVNGSGTIVNPNAKDAQVQGADGDVQLACTVTTVNGSFDFFVQYIIDSGNIVTYSEFFITSTATDVIWSVNSNSDVKYNIEIYASTGMIFSDSGIQIQFMNGTVPYVKQTPNEALAFNVDLFNGSVSQAIYSCPTQPFNPLLRKRNTVETLTVEVPNIPAETPTGKKGRGKLSN